MCNKFFKSKVLSRTTSSIAQYQGIMDFDFDFDFDFLFFSAGIFISLPIFWHFLSMKKPNGEKKTNISTLVVLGSGGHTAEMLRLVSGLDSNVYSPLTFVLADSDLRSEEKLKLSITSREFQVLKLPRAREVAQSWLSSVISFFKVKSVAKLISNTAVTKPNGEFYSVGEWGRSLDHL